MTHSYVTMQVSAQAYDEIKKILIDAGYDHAIGDHGELDMHGIAIVCFQPSLRKDPTSAYDAAMGIIS